MNPDTAVCQPSSPPYAICVSNTPSNPPYNGRPTPHPPQPPTQSSSVAYPPARGVPWKWIPEMMQEDKSCPGCHFNHPNDSPSLKFHQDVGCVALAKHGYICRKYVTASAKVVDRFNNKFPKMTDQAQTNNPFAKRVSNSSSSDQVDDMGHIQVHTGVPIDSQTVIKYLIMSWTQDCARTLSNH